MNFSPGSKKGGNFFFLGEAPNKDGVPSGHFSFARIGENEVWFHVELRGGKATLNKFATREVTEGDVTIDPIVLSTAIAMKL